jgi:hypothetical protein
MRRRALMESDDAATRYERFAEIFISLIASALRLVYSQTLREFALEMPCAPVNRLSK